MRQLSLFDDSTNLAGLLSALRSALSLVVGQDESGRKVFIDRVNQLSAQAGIRLTSGNSRQMSLDTLNKVLSPSDKEHPPSVLITVAICMLTNRKEPLQILARACGHEVITKEERDILEWAKAELAKEKAKSRARILKEKLG